MKIPKTSDYITHTDVIRRFVESPNRITIVDYTSTKDARSVCVLFRQFLSEREIDYVRIIQRGPDVIFYKVRKNGNRRA